MKNTETLHVQMALPLRKLTDCCRLTLSTSLRQRELSRMAVVSQVIYDKQVNREEQMTFVRHEPVQVYILSLTWQQVSELRVAKS
jgi:hypothetical protein